MSSNYQVTNFDEDNVEKTFKTCCGYCYLTKTQKMTCKTVIAAPFVFLAILVLALLIATATVKEKFQLEKLSQAEVKFIDPSEKEASKWAKNLGRSIQMATVSWNNTSQNSKEIVQFLQFLNETFPKVFSSQYVKVYPVNTLSLLIKVQGAKTTKNPYMLAAHFDVVPPGDYDRWDHDPFLGDIVEENGEKFVFGRGAIDDKHSLMGILQALDVILTKGQRPQRSFYIGFGHDEEIGGHQGAGHIAPLLETMLNENDEELDFLLDEGMTVMQGVVPGVADPVIYIGVVEKGWAMLELSVEGEQKHSSTPPRHSAPGILAAALANLENHPSPSKFKYGPEYDTMTYLAPYMGFINKLALANMWMFTDLVSNILARDENTDAIQRTTTAITIIEAGFKDNVVPGSARAVVNHRIHPSETLDDILEHDRKVIDDDRVKIKTLGYTAPPPVSSYSNDVIPFQIVANSAVQVFPSGHVTPGTLVANTDTRHYVNLTNHIYRFTPAFIQKEDIRRIHGYNERISISNYVQVVEFYYRIIHNADTRV